jgi:hypothetical protein
MYRYEIIPMEIVDLKTVHEDINRYAKQGMRLVSVVDAKVSGPEHVPNAEPRHNVLFIFEEEIDDAGPASN